MTHISLLGLVIVFTCSAISMASPGDHLDTIKLSAFNSKQNAKWSQELKDIMQHEAPGDHNNYSDLITLAHETSHGIHAYIRNHLNNTGTRVNGFYILNNEAVIVKEPKIRKSDVARYVPQSLRGMRYSTYVTGQSAWDDTPLYIWDEWNAYVNGAVAGVSLVNSGLWNYGWRDGVAGSIEFNVYALATGMAVKNRDPDYFNNYHQFKEFLAFNLKRSMKAFLEGRMMSVFTWATQDKYYQSFKQAPDAEAVRQFCRETYGTDWCYDVIGF